MFCQNCGAQIDNNSPFCPSCGFRLSNQIPSANAQNFQNPQQAYTPAQNTFNGNYNGQGYNYGNVSEGYQYQGGYDNQGYDYANQGYSYAGQDYVQPDVSQENNKKPLIIKAVIASVVAVAIIVSGVLFIPKLFSKVSSGKDDYYISAAKKAGIQKDDPKVQLLTEIHNFVFGTGSFTLDVSGELTDDTDVSVKAELGKDLLSSSFYLNASEKYSSSAYQVEYVFYDGKLAVLTNISRKVQGNTTKQGLLNIIDAVSILNEKDVLVSGIKENIGEPYEDERDLYNTVFAKDFNKVEKSLLALVSGKEISFSGIQNIYDSNIDIIESFINYLYMDGGGAYYNGKVPSFRELYECFAEFAVTTEGIRVTETRDGAYSVSVNLSTLLNDVASFITTNEKVAHFFNDSKLIAEIAEELRYEASDEDLYGWDLAGGEIVFNDGKLSNVYVHFDGESLLNLNFTDVDNTKVDSSIYNSIADNKNNSNYEVHEINTAQEFCDRLY